MTGNPSGFVRAEDISSKPLVEGEHIKITDNGTGIVVAFSGDLQPTADYAYQSSLSSYQEKSGMTAYQPASAMSSYYPTSNPSGFITGVNIPTKPLVEGDHIKISDNGTGIVVEFSGDLQPTADYAYQSSLSSYQEKSAMTAYQPKSGMSAYYGANNPSGFITGVDLSNYQPKSAMTAYQPSGNYLTQDDVSGKVDNTAIGAATLGDDTHVVTSISGSGLYAYSATNAASAGYADHALSAGSATMDSSGHNISKYYIPTSESSKYLQSGDVTGYQPTSAMSAYQETSAMTGYATTALLESGLSGKMDTTAGLIVSSTASGLRGYNSVMLRINNLEVSARVAGFCQNCNSASAAGSAYSASQAQVAVNLSGVPKSSIVQYSAISGDGTSITSIGGSAVGGGGGTEWVSGQFGEYNYVSSNLGIIGGKSGLMSATSEVYNPDGTATGSAASTSTFSWQTGQYYPVMSASGSAKPLSSVQFTSTVSDTQEITFKQYFNDLPSSFALTIGGTALSASASASGNELAPGQSTYMKFIELTGKIGIAPTALANSVFAMYAREGTQLNYNSAYVSANVINHGTMETATSYMTADILATIMGG